MRDGLSSFATVSGTSGGTQTAPWRASWRRRALDLAAASRARAAAARRPTLRHHERARGDVRTRGWLERVGGEAAARRQHDDEGVEEGHGVDATISSRESWRAGDLELSQRRRSHRTDIGHGCLLATLTASAKVQIVSPASAVPAPPRSTRRSPSSAATRCIPEMFSEYLAKFKALNAARSTPRASSRRWTRVDTRRWATIWHRPSFGGWRRQWA